MRTAWHMGEASSTTYCVNILCHNKMLIGAISLKRNWYYIVSSNEVLLKGKNMTKHFFFFFFFCRNRSCVNWYSYKVPKGPPFLKFNLFRRIINEQKYMAQSGLILLNHLKKGNDHSIFNETTGVLSQVQVLYQTGIVNQLPHYSA